MLSAPADDADPAVALWRDFVKSRPDTKTVDLILPDLAGVVRGKRISADAMPGALRGHVGFSSSLYGLDTTGTNVDASGLIWEEGDADRAVAVDLATLVPVPWRPGGAQIIGG